MSMYAPKDDISVRIFSSCDAVHLLWVSIAGKSSARWSNQIAKCPTFSVVLADMPNFLF